MRYRLFGPTGLRVSDLFLGAMTFGHDPRWEGLYGTPPADCRAVFESYAEAGGNVIDTANRYTNGDSERIVGDLLGADRHRFVVSTKYTLTIDEADPNASGSHRKSLVRSLEQSLDRLRTDYVDLLWVHIWDRNTPIDETMRVLDDAVREGKVLYVGISDSPAWLVAQANTLASLRGWTPFAGVQLPYSLVQRDADRELLPLAEALGLSVAAWSPLGGGLLSGKYGDQAASGRLRADQISDRDRRIAETVTKIASEIDAAPAQVAIAWIRSRSARLHPIVAGRTAEQLAANLAAVDLALPDAARGRLDAVSRVELGFPTDMIASTRNFVYGPVGELVDDRRST